MLLDSLARRPQPSRYQGIGSGVLESKHHGVFLNKLWIDYLPNLPMNLLSLSQITLNTQWEVRYEHAQSEFVMRTTGGHKLVFTLFNNFYVCDMATSIFRSHRARVKDAVELFTAPYMASPVGIYHLQNCGRLFYTVQSRDQHPNWTSHIWRSKQLDCIFHPRSIASEDRSSHVANIKVVK